MSEADRADRSGTAPSADGGSGRRGESPGGGGSVGPGGGGTVNLGAWGFLKALSATQEGPPASLRRTLALALVLPPFVALQLLHWLCLRADDLLFPGYRIVQVREPLFVVGLPRSGTTFLHRTLALDEDRFTTLRLWQLLLAPSVLQRKILGGLGAVDRALGRPVGRLLAWTERRVLGFMDEIHPTSLAKPEEDYLFLLPAFAAFILILAVPGHPRLWAVARLDTLDDDVRVSLVEFYRSCLQRHLYLVGTDRRILSKNPSFSSFVETLAQLFPDARFVACARDPREAVASQLSSLKEGAAFFGWDVADPAYRDRIVDALVYYGDHLAATLPGLGEGRWAWCPLSSLGPDLERQVTRIYGRLGWEPGPAFQEALADAGERSRRYRSSHSHDLEKYGLREGLLLARFRRFCAAASLDLPEPSDSASP